jgi:hypothetical protein
VDLGSGKSPVLEFQFNVPATVANGAFICAGAYIGQEPSPSFGVLGTQQLFCISKQSAAFTLVPENQVQQQAQQLRQAEKKSKDSLRKALELDKPNLSPIR